MTVLDPAEMPDGARIALLEQAMQHMQDAVDELLRKLTDEPDGGRPSRWSWHHATPQRRAQMWSELRAFVDWLIGRYQPGGSVEIRPCWYRHPVAVEELWALMAAWRASYCGTEQATDQLTTWHQHWLWPCLQRLGTYAGWAGCGTGHKPPTGVTPSLTDDAFADYIRSAPAVNPSSGDPAAVMESSPDAQRAKP